MKIAILTLPLHINYGGILQAFALQNILLKRGFEVEIIEEKTNRQNIVRRILNWLSKRGRSQRSKAIERFVKGRMNVRKFRSFDFIPEGQFDAIIVGSDQIWRAEFHKDIRIPFLSFASNWHNLKRIGYAISFGKDTISYTKNEIEDCKFLIKKFDTLSFREASGVEICSNTFGLKSIQVLDPTMLLTVEDYKQLVIENRKLQKNHLFVYVMDESEKFINIIDVFSRRYEDNVHVYNMTQLESKGKYPSIEQWLSEFKDAEYVLTDSFHGCVFCILFHKPFAVYDNSLGGSTRIESLLDIFQLKDRRIDNESQINGLLETPINWDNVDSILERERDKSHSYLFNHLH